MTHLVLPAAPGFSLATLRLFHLCVPVGFLCFANILCWFLLHALCMYCSLGLELLFTATSHPSLWHQFLLRERISNSPNLVLVTSLTLKLPYTVILVDFLHGSWYYLNILVVLLVYYLMRVQTLTCSLWYP